MADPDFLTVDSAETLPAAITHAHETVRQVYDGLRPGHFGEGPLLPLTPSEVRLVQSDQMRAKLAAAGVPLNPGRPVASQPAGVDAMQLRHVLAPAALLVGDDGWWRRPLHGTPGPAPDPDRYIAADGAWSAWRKWPDVMREIYNLPPVDEHKELPLPTEHPVDAISEWRRADHAARSVRKSDSGSRRQQQAWSRRRDRLAPLAVDHYSRLVPVFEQAVEAAFEQAAAQGGPTPSAPVPTTKGRPSWR